MSLKRKVVEVRGPEGAGGVVTISHGLGVIPHACRLVEVRAKDGLHSGCSVTACSVKANEWTAQDVKVDIWVGMGSAEGATLYFEIEGKEV